MCLYSPYSQVLFGFSSQFSKKNSCVVLMSIYIHSHVNAIKCKRMYHAHVNIQILSHFNALCVYFPKCYVSMEIPFCVHSSFGPSGCEKNPIGLSLNLMGFSSIEIPFRKVASSNIVMPIIVNYNCVLVTYPISYLLSYFSTSFSLNFITLCQMLPINLSIHEYDGYLQIYVLSR